MGCLRVRELNDYLIEPLIDGLKDSNSYVRKTAVMCVPKLYEITPELVEKTDALKILQKIFEDDGNPQVVANCVQALVEISNISKKKLIEVNSDNLERILLVLNDTFEWGQVFLLDLLAEFKKATKSEAEL